MNEVLTITRWGFTIPVLILECVFKALLEVFICALIIVMAVFYPCIRKGWNRFDKSIMYEYATNWNKFYFTKKIFRLWQQYQQTITEIQLGHLRHGEKLTSLE